jgi:hypothetical protein
MGVTPDRRAAILGLVNLFDGIGSVSGTRLRPSSLTRLLIPR